MNPEPWNPQPGRQQIIISGVGGQGVLFVTRLLAEAAISKGFSVFTSETHGMAQRGGTVVSHLKVGDFSSPLIRPGAADGLLALHAESMGQHGAYVKPDGWIVVNSRIGVSSGVSGSGPPSVPSSVHIPVHKPIHNIDATKIARESGNPKSVNLVVLGFALGRTLLSAAGGAGMVVSKADILSVLESRLSGNPGMLEASVWAVEAGHARAKS
jgi:indolepyruvate ferredoxin oxidoreductase beta subunit